MRIALEEIFSVLKRNLHQPRQMLVGERSMAPFTASAPVRHIASVRGVMPWEAKSSYLVPLLCVYVRGGLYVAALDTAQSLRHLLDDPASSPVRRYTGKADMPLVVDP